MSPTRPLRPMHLALVLGATACAARSAPRATTHPAVPAAPAALGGLDLDAWCQSAGHRGAALQGPQRAPDAALHWRCTTTDGGEAPVDFDAACRAQHAAPAAVARFSDPDDAYTWSCYPGPLSQWTRTPDVAAYWNVAEGARWDGLLRIERGLTLQEAMQHAAADPRVTYFFFTTGGQLVLEVGREDRTFQHGDTVFFRGEPWWGGAPGLADGYRSGPVTPQAPAAP